jgi:hypothetical protein
MTTMPVFQNQVFLEVRDCASGKLQNQAFAPGVSGYFLKGQGFDAGCCPFCNGDYFLFARHPAQSMARPAFRKRRHVFPFSPRMSTSEVRTTSSCDKVRTDEARCVPREFVHRDELTPTLQWYELADELDALANLLPGKKL